LRLFIRGPSGHATVNSHTGEADKNEDLTVIYNPLLTAKKTARQIDNLPGW
jgi:hypothetical protein